MNRFVIALSVFMTATGLLPAFATLPNELVETLVHPDSGSQTGLEQGTSVAYDGNRIAVGAPDDDSAGEDRGMVRVYDATSGALLHEIPGSGEGFGSSVALSSNRLAVGQDTSGTGYYDGPSTTVSIFDLDAADPAVPEFTIEEPNAPSFGAGIDLEGDRLVVGAPDDASWQYGLYQYSREGRLYIYDLGDATPEQWNLTIDGATNSQLGECVAVEGDFVAASGANDSSAWVYDLSSGTPEVPIAELQDPDGRSLDSAIAIDYPYVVASRDDQYSSSNGVAQVFDLTSPTPSDPVVTLGDPTPGQSTSYTSEFGSDVDIAGTKVAVGCAQDGTNVSGSVYIFDITAPSPEIPLHTVENPVADFKETFGAAVALEGAMLVVGAPRSSVDAPSAGIAYQYDLLGGSPTTPLRDFGDPGPELEKEFGASVSLHGRYLAVGVPRDDAEEADGGTAAVFDLEGATPTTPLFLVPSPEPQSYAQFGSAVALEGRYLAVGAPEQDVGSEYEAGTVYLYDVLAANPATPIQTLVSDVPDRYEEFGDSVGLAGTWIVVTEPGQEKVHVFERGNTNGPVAVLTEQPDLGNEFGASLAVDTNRFAVGAPDDSFFGQGWVYVYDLPATNSSAPTFSLSAPPSGTYLYGSSVALSGKWLAVGDVPATYLYDLSATNPAASVIKIDQFTQVGGVALSGDRLIIYAAEGVEAFDLGSSDPLGTSSSIDPGILAFEENSPVTLSLDGSQLCVGVPLDDTAGNNNGAVYVFDRSATPEIKVETPEVALRDGESTLRIGLGGLGVPTDPVEVTVRNGGGVALTGLSISTSGPQAGDFLVNSAGLPTSLAPDQSGTFTVAFQATGTSLRRGFIHIASNDADENPFDLEVQGWALSATQDTDGDGLNDLAELEMEDLGFDWQDPQPDLVAALQDNANLAELYTQDDIATLVAPSLLLERDPMTDRFALTLDMKWTTDHATYNDLPASPVGLGVDTNDNIRFEFQSPVDRAFFRVDSQP